MVLTGNLKEIAYGHLREMIQDGRLEAGVVYSERKISGEIGVSRTPFHAALLQLEKDGYLDVLPSRGFLLHQMNEQDVRQTYEVRSAIEFYCAARLFTDFRAGVPESVRAMENLAGLMDRQREVLRSGGTVEEFLTYDFAFHREMVEYVDNQEFNEIFRSYTYKIHRLAAGSLAHPGRMEQTVGEHQAILDTLRDGKPGDLYPVTMRHFTVPQDINLEDINR